jgi:phosphoesterase RecJ-like protein
MSTTKPPDPAIPDDPSYPNGESQRPAGEFIAALHGVRRPFLVAHVTPDADAIGAALGLATALREHEIDPVVGLTAKNVAMRLRFMFDLAPHVPQACTWKQDGHHDAFIVLDTAAAKRIDLEPVPDLDGGIPIFNIDHHITNPDFGRYNWVDPHASSTCEMIARLIRHLGWRLTSNVASLLYAGLHGDTVGFSVPSTSAAALHMAGDLVQAGADVTHIGEQLCRSQGQPEFELLRRVYDHTTVTDDGRISYSFLSYRDITESHCKADDIDDQVSIPRALKNVRIAMLFSEGAPGVIRVNLRGEGRTTVLEIAQRFGGGGHKQSAGVRLRDRTMEQAIREVIEAAQAHLRS